MNKLVLLAMIAVLSNFLPASGQVFTIGDIETGRNSYLKPESLDQIRWRTGTNEIVYESGDTIYSLSVNGNDRKPLLNLAVLNKDLGLENENCLTSMPEFVFTERDEIYFESPAIVCFYNLKEHTYREVPVSTFIETIIPDGKGHRLAYIDGSDLFVTDRTGELIRISHDTLEAVMNGEFAYRNEFGSDKGIFWSPCGKRMAYYHKDERAVEIYPLVDINHTVATLVRDRYPMAGRTMEDTEVRIYDISTGREICVCPPEGAGIYMTNLSWTQDGSTLYIQHLNRGQDSLVVIPYSAKTGKAGKILISETHPKYVEPLYPLHFFNSAPGDFLYQSRRSGYNHIYRFDASENQLLPLTSGEWEVTELLGTDPAEECIFFMGTQESPLERHLYRLELSTGETQCITSGKGTHEVIFNDKMTHFIDQWNSRTVPNTLSVYTSEGKKTATLLEASNPVQDYRLGEVETGTFKAGDGKTDLYYRLVKPVDMTADGKYPLIVYVYGGPHVQLITDSWMDRIDYLQQYFAQNGYASLIIDSRGSDGRGLDFENAIFRQHGIPQLQDQIRGIDFIRKVSWIDTGRIGVHGWSYGGFMTLNMMLNHPETYKVGVAGGPVTDWSLYEVMYGERYMDTPAENPEGYRQTNMVEKAGRLQGDLLIIQGGMDDVVVPQNALLFIQECIKQDKPVDFFIYPDHEHNVRGKDRVHLTRMITEYFFENL